MKKRCIGLIMIIVILMGGCQPSSDQFLSFQPITSSVDFNLSQNDYFAKNAVIIPQDEVFDADFEFTSGAALLVNSSDNEAIYADNIYTKLYPASLTKLMTALVILQYGELTDTVTVSYNASHITEPGAKLCGFEEGDVITLEALLYSLLIYSGNDAAVAAAEHVGGSVEAFVDKMNKEAKSIGAVHTNFINPSGLHDDNHYTTAYDIYLIFNKLMNFDIFRTIISTPSYTVTYQDVFGNSKEKTFTSTNSYLTGKASVSEGLTVIGGKTGNTSKAGSCLALLCKKEDNTEYIAVVMKAKGSDMLYSQMTELLSLTEAR